jgi:MFS family permease
MTLGAFFNPAAKAVTAAVVKREELVAANTLTIMTFSVSFAWGAALGGIIVALFDPWMAFLVDAASFFISAACTASITVPAVVEVKESLRSPLRGLGEGLRYVSARLHLTLLTLTGTFYGAGAGGFWVLLSLYGTALFPLGDRGSISLGLLYTAVGVGSILGPLVGQRLSQTSSAVMYRLLGPSFLVLAAAFVGLSLAPNLGIATLGMVLASAAVAVIWLYLVALLQMEVPGRLLGRVFALANTGQAIATSLSSYLIGLAADVGEPRDEARHLSWVLAELLAPSGILLALALRPPRAATPVLPGRDESQVVQE